MFWKKKANISQDAIAWNNCIPLKKMTVWCWLYLLIEGLIFTIFFGILDKILIFCAFERKEQYGSIYYNIHGETTIVFVCISVIGMILILIMSIVLAYIVMKKVIVERVFNTIKKHIEAKKDSNIDRDTIQRKEHTIITFVLYIVRVILSIFAMICLFQCIQSIFEQIEYIIIKYFVDRYYLYEYREIDSSQLSDPIKAVIDNAKDLYFSLRIDISSYYNWVKSSDGWWYLSFIYFITIPLIGILNYIIKYIQIEICPACKIIDGSYVNIERILDDVKEKIVHRNETKEAYIDNKKSVWDGAKVNLNVISKYNVAMYTGHYIIKCKHCGQRLNVKFKHKEEKKIGEEIY